MKTGFVIHQGRKVFCRSAGAGDQLVFLHADFVDGRMWDAVMGVMQSRYAITAYDKLGYGFSEKASGRLCRRRELADVMDSMGVDAAHLVGCSNGGQQALDFALENPKRVKSLVLVNSSPSGFQPMGQPPEELLEMIRASREGKLDEANELQIRIWFDGPRRTAASLDQERLRARESAKAMNRIVIENATFPIADMDPLDPLAPPAVGRLREVHIPVLVVSGALDYDENRRASRLLADGIPDSHFVEMRDCAHVPSLEAPGTFVKILEGFLDGALRLREGEPGVGQ